MTENLLDPKQLAQARAERADGRISACYWFPRIENAGLPVPRTVFVPYDHANALEAFDGGGDAGLWRRTEEGVMDAAGRVGFPAFVRTDITSAKHDGPTAYRLESASGSLERVLYETVADNEEKLWLTGPWPQAFMVREWLNLDAPFTAFRGHPIACEWRLFTGLDGKVVCSHFYWPEDAIEGNTEAVGWKEQLADLRLMRHPDLGRWAEVAARVCDDHGTEWSVDFARTKDGRWYLIDMAPANVSFHDFPDGHA